MRIPLFFSILVTIPSICFGASPEVKDFFEQIPFINGFRGPHCRVDTVGVNWVDSTRRVNGIVVSKVRVALQPSNIPGSRFKVAYSLRYPESGPYVTWPIIAGDWYGQYTVRHEDPHKEAGKEYEFEVEFDHINLHTRKPDPEIPYPGDSISIQLSAGTHWGCDIRKIDIPVREDLDRLIKENN